jgi:uncharacterized protein YbjT (DUF2867 family)
MRQRTFFVAGATGKQGGALARQLLAAGHSVRAYTRKPGGDAARALQRLGADLVAGGFDEAGPLERGMRGCDGAFGMTAFAEAGIDAEVRRGRALVDAAKWSRVPHLVLASIAGAERPTGVAHMDSKFQIERYLAHAGVPYTIVAPVFFMENWLAVLPAAAARGELRYPLPSERTLQLVAVEDVAQFARMALERPIEFESRRVEIAGETLTMERIAAVLGAAAQCPLRYRAIPLETVWARNADLGRLCSWLDWEGTHIDVLRLRSRYRDVHWTSLEAWARGQDWSRLLGVTAGETTPAGSAWVRAQGAM